MYKLGLTDYRHWVVKGPRNIIIHTSIDKETALSYLKACNYALLEIRKRIKTKMLKSLLYF